MNPETLIPKISATALRRPSDPILPSPLKSNSRTQRPSARRPAMRRDVRGHQLGLPGRVLRRRWTRLPSLVGTLAQSPSAQTSSWPLTRKVPSTASRPFFVLGKRQSCRSAGAARRGWSRPTSWSGCDRAAGPASTADSPVAACRRQLSNSSTPRLRRIFWAKSAELGLHLGQDAVLRVHQHHADLPGVDAPIELARRARTKSFSSATTSTPEKPPPATTNVRSCRRSSGSSLSTSASSSARMTRLRSSSASARFLNGNACSGRPGKPRKSVTVPGARTRWS